MENLSDEIQTAPKISLLIFLLFIAASQLSHSTLLIVVICGAFVALIGGIGIARLRNNGQHHHHKQRLSDKQQTHLSQKVERNINQYIREFVY